MSQLSALKNRLGRPRRHEPWQVPDQTGRRILITGANSGLGLEVARRLAGAGAQVVMGVRNQAKGEQARADLLIDHPAAQVELAILDVANLASIASFADSWGDRPLDVLVNNAGVMTPPQREQTVDGFELQFGTNVLGPQALTSRLLPALLAGDAPRVVTVASLAANFGRIDFGDLQWRRRRYLPFGAYAQSKLADLLLGRHLAEVAAQRSWPLISTMAHPGLTKTNLLANGRAASGRPAHSWAPDWVQQTVECGADPLLRAAADTGVANGSYYGPKDYAGAAGPAVLVKPPKPATNPELAANLWTVAEQLTGVQLPD